jgi:hypothetical protein
MFLHNKNVITNGAAFKITKQSYPDLLSGQEGP